MLNQKNANKAKYLTNKSFEHHQKSFHPLKYPDGTNGILTIPILCFLPR